MSEEEFINLKLIVGQVVLLHLTSGHTTCGAYRGNFNKDRAQFDLENHKTMQLEKVSLNAIDKFVI